MTLPSEGEGAAVSGYRYQYFSSAALVLAALMDGSLRWIRLKDVDAGRVDDFVIGRDHRVDGYQFKHRSTGAFTFRNLTAEETESSAEPTNSSVLRRRPSLIKQLADGWLSLRGTGGPRIVVHLATNARSSTADKVPVDDGTPGPKHFTAFLEGAWAFARTADPTAAVVIPAKWCRAWEALRTASGLDDQRFVAFVRDCEFDFRVEPESILGSSSRDDLRTRSDLDAIRHLLFDEVALVPAPVTLDFHGLLDRLGWSSRFRPSNPHVFPIDNALYRPIQASVDDLEATMGAHSGGYVGVIGSPGSGKSTLLTDVLRFRPERVVHYYAFLPDARNRSIGRGESENFLHDLVLALHESGFSGGTATIGFDRPALLERLLNQLRLLHEDWERTGTKTLILVDGLDHVDREERPSRSFLDDLLDPSLIPDGVVILLGSQTDAVLPPNVRVAVQDPSRRVEMKPLGRGDIFDIVEKAGMPLELSEPQRERVAELSAGHPLALVYLLNALRIAGSAELAQQVLDETPPFTGDIGARYQSAWQQIADDGAAVKALGYAARMRGPVDLNWLESRVGFEPVHAVRRRFGHFFRNETDGRWYFFHDSFRIFLLQRTGETWEGHPDAARDAELHRQLAGWLGDEPRDSPRAWDELYHRACAGQDEVVVALATQQRFRSQALALRAIDAIREDIALALPSVVRRRDTVALARLVLAGAELGQREWHRDLGSVVRILIGLDEPLIAVEHLRSGWHLRASRRTALEASPLLDDAGLTTEAFRLFDLAEPIDLLGSGKEIEVHHSEEDWNLVTAWAEVAPRFRSVDRVLQIICRMRFRSSLRSISDPEEYSRHRRDQLVYLVGIGLSRERRWEDVASVAGLLDKRAAGEELDWWVWLNFHAWSLALSDGDGAMAQQFLDAVLDNAEPASLGSEERTAVAEAVYRIAGDESLARTWLEGVPQPQFDPLEFGLDAEFRPFDQQFRLNRLLSALGDAQDSAVLVPDSVEHPRPGTTRFERFVRVVAGIAGAAWHGKIVPADRLRALIRPWLDLYDRRLEYWSDDPSWYLARGARAGLVERLVAAAADHGFAAVDGIREEVEASWRAVPWTNDDRRAAILSLAEHGMSRTWAVDALQAIEVDSPPFGLTVERIDECEHRAGAWLALGNPEAARVTLARLLTETNAIAFRKDHQLTDWIDGWLADANTADPGGAADRVRWFARATLVLEETTEEGADRTAAEALLGSTFRWSPRRAVKLLAWYLDRRLARLDKALNQFLRAALDAPSPPLDLIRSLMVETAVPIAFEGPSRSLLTKLFAVEIDQVGRHATVDTARRLAVRAATLGLPESRKYWRRWMTEALEPIGIGPEEAGLDVLPAESRHEYFPRPSLSGAPVPTEPEIDSDDLRRNSTNDLGDRFDWSPLVERVASGEPISDLSGIVEVFTQKELGGRAMMRLGEALLSRGHRHLAYDAFNAGLDGERSLGWERAWGGGEKIDAARRLAELDASRAIPQIFDRLAADLTENPGLSATIARNFREIAPLLADPLPIRELWGEVEDFVGALFAAHELPEADLSWLDDRPGSDEPSDGLADSVAMLLRYPVFSVAQSAQRVVALGILRGDPAIARLVDAGLRDKPDSQVALLEVLDAASIVNSGSLAAFQTAVTALTASPDFDVRAIAQDVSRRLSWSFDPPPRILRPATYDIALPPEFPQDIKLFEHRIVDVARVVGVSAAAVAWRLATIMREIGDPNTWSSTAERRLGNTINSASVHLPFRRPRVTIARRAFFRIVAELVDSGDLDPEDLIRLDPILRIHDPAMVLEMPSIRPAPIEAMEPPNFGREEDAWIARTRDACESRAKALISSDDSVMLAERTEFRHVDRRYASEERRVALGRWGDLGPLGGQVRFAGPYACPLSSYSDASVKTRPVPLVIENAEFNGYDTPAPRWLALNPEVGRMLGWHLSADVPPRWVDATGAPMAWTVWWCDGIVNTNWAASTCVVGEGWLVAVSRPAAEELRRAFGTMQYRVWIRRSLEAVEAASELRRECDRIVPF